MIRSQRPRTFPAVAAALAAGLALATLPAGLAAAVPDQSGAPMKLSPLLRADASTPTPVFVTTTGPGALAVDAAAKSGELDRSAAPDVTTRRRLSQITATTNDVISDAKTDSSKTHVLYTSKYTVPGVAMIAPADVLTDLAKRPDVVSVTPLVAKQAPDPSAASEAAPMNGGADTYTRALNAWRSTGHIGSNINIAIIDTGLDYTHADFGGPGTAAAYRTALASSDAPPPGLYDGKKFLGGYDFAGKTYNADTSGAYDPLPQPDANPIDGPGGGHGSHVAGTAAGFGVTDDGKPFRGAYGSLSSDDLTHMQIGPGSAPGAGLYSLKVFGDNGGSTDLTGAALDYLGKMLTEGKDINVVNLSLGSNYSAADDPDNAKIDALTKQGVLPVISAGNSGNVTDIAGSPGNSVAALTVAAAASGYGLYDQVAVTAPTDDAAKGLALSQYSQGFEDPISLSGAVATLRDDATGCKSLSAADTARVKGNIAILSWNDDAPECGSATRFDNAAAAGATGVLLTSKRNVFDTGIAGDATIPGAQLTADATARLLPAAQAGTLHVELREDLRGTVTAYNASNADKIAAFSSRGAHGSVNDLVKPDVSSPGVGVVSVKAGTGTGRTAMSGTSMAAPHAAGIAALTFEAHPGWTPSQVKADIMNTASHDTTTSDGAPTSLLQQGTGRVDAADAVDNQVTLTSTENGDLITASFGVVSTARPVSLKRTLVLKNSGNVSRSYTIGVAPTMPLPGVTYQTDRTAVTVSARGAATATLTMTIKDPKALRRVIDPTQSRTITVDGKASTRDFVTVGAARVDFTSTVATAPSLRIAAFVAPEPASSMSGNTATFSSAKATAATLPLHGTSLKQGTGGEQYQSNVAPLVLSGVDPADDYSKYPAATTLHGLDIRAFGAASTAPLQRDKSNGLLIFGVQRAGTEPIMGASSQTEVLIDTDRDGTADYITALQRSTDTDSAWSVTTDTLTGEVVSNRPAQGQTADNDVNTSDTSVDVLTVPLKALGFEKTASTATFNYRVVTASLYAPKRAETGDYTVDSAAWVRFDGYKPPLWFTQAGSARGGSAVYADAVPGIIVHRAVPNAAKVLLLHLRNLEKAQGQIVPVVTAKH